MDILTLRRGAAGPTAPAQAPDLAQAPAPAQWARARAAAPGTTEHPRQVDRIAMARGLPATAVRDAIRDATTGPAFGLVGDPVVNVLTANLALDALKG